jgi:hypothetical protein
MIGGDVDPLSAAVRRYVRPRRGDCMRYLLAVVTVLAVALGVAGMLLGEADDSPGLQGLGALLIIGAIALGVRTARRSS